MILLVRNERKNIRFLVMKSEWQMIIRIYNFIIRKCEVINVTVFV